MSTDQLVLPFKSQSLTLWLTRSCNFDYKAKAMGFKWRSGSICLPTIGVFRKNVILTVKEHYRSERWKDDSYCKKRPLFNFIPISKIFMLVLDIAKLFLPMQYTPGGQEHGECSLAVVRIRKRDPEVVIG